MNAERRIQRVRKAIEPLGHSKPDWEIICAVGREMGNRESFPYATAEEIWNEIRQVWPAGRGITYARLEEKGLQWPCLNEDHSGTTILHVNEFGNGKTTALRRIPYRPTPEGISEEFPFVLITGRTLYQFNAGTMTRRTPNSALLPTDYLEIAVEDANRLQLNSGDRVRVSSRYGETTIPIRITRTVTPGELFATLHDSEIFLNHVTSPHRDRYVKTPEYKVTAVQIEKAEG